VRTFVDSRGKAIRVPHPPRRIVSIVPSVTELLFAAGAGDRIAGVTTYCDTPPEAKAKPKIGDIVVDIERLVAIQPDLVVTAYHMTRQATEELEARGFTVFAVDPGDFDGIAAALRLLGELTGHEAEGRAAAERLLERVRAASAPQEARGPTVYFESSVDPLWTAGAKSYAGDALRLAGGRNIFESGWQQVDWEVVVARDPEVILISHGRREGLDRRAGWQDLRAVKGGRIHFVRKEGFLYPTPRLVDGLEEASRILHAKNP
jgi:iron complex transport system substrate-binding protein